MRTSILLLALVVSPAYGEGALDPTFGQHGMQIISEVKSGEGDGGKVGRAIALRPDGGFYVVGDSNGGSLGTGGLQIASRLSNGSSDSAFSGGDALKYLHPGSANMQLVDAASQADGRLIVYGIAEKISDGLDALFVCRFLQDGSIDQTFGSAQPKGCHIASGPMIYSRVGSQIGALLVQTDGKISAVFGIKGESIHPAILRLQANGTPDASVSPTGMRMIESFAEDVLLNSIVQAPDGSLVTAGAVSFSGSNADVIAFRLKHGNGELDPTFKGFGNSAGTSTVAFDLDADAGVDGAVGVASMPDGSVIIAASVQTTLGTYQSGAVKLKSNGRTDENFGPDGNGKVLYADCLAPVNCQATPSSIALQPDGRFFIGGTYYSAGAFGFRSFAIRVLPNGKLDKTFGPIAGGTPAGMVALDFKQNGTMKPSDRGSDLVMQDGNLLLFGSVRGIDESTLAVARVVPSISFTDGFE